MRITKDQLRSWEACRAGYEWFLRRFPDGEADYQAVLDALAADDRPADANWLMDRAGADATAVLEVEAIGDTTHLFFAGRIVVELGAVLSGWLRAGDGIKAGWGIKAGDGIHAGQGINAGLDINAGWGIKAGDGIETGEGWACFAGLRLCVAQWPVHAIVTAKTKPAHLRGGFWIEPVAINEMGAA